MFCFLFLSFPLSLSPSIFRLEIFHSVAARSLRSLHVLELINSAFRVALADLPQGLVLVAALLAVVLVEQILLGELAVLAKFVQLLAECLQLVAEQFLLAELGVALLLGSRDVLVAVVMVEITGLDVRGLIVLLIVLMLGYVMVGRGRRRGDQRSGHL